MSLRIRIIAICQDIVQLHVTLFVFLFFIFTLYFLDGMNIRIVSSFEFARHDKNHLKNSCTTNLHQ